MLFSWMLNDMDGQISKQNCILTSIYVFCVIDWVLEKKPVKKHLFSTCVVCTETVYAKQSCNIG